MGSNRIFHDPRASHSGFEPTDPPPPMPEHRIHDTHALVAGFYAWGQRTSRAVVIVLALWGTISTPAAAAFAYWGSHQGYITQDQHAVDARTLSEIHESQIRIELTMSDKLAQLANTEDRLNALGNSHIRLESWAEHRGYKR